MPTRMVEASFAASPTSSHSTLQAPLPRIRQIAQPYRRQRATSNVIPGTPMAKPNSKRWLQRASVVRFAARGHECTIVGI